MSKCLNKVFKAVVNEILQVLPTLGKSGSEVSYFIPYSRKISEVNRFKSKSEEDQKSNHHIKLF